MPCERRRLPNVDSGERHGQKSHMRCLPCCAGHVAAQIDRLSSCAVTGSDVRSNSVVSSMRRLGWCAAIVVFVGSAGCASVSHRDGVRTAQLERLYFGRNIGDTATVSDSAWARFVDEIITPAFPEGATVFNADGQWRAPNGTIVRERSFVVELLHFVTPDVEQRIQRIIDAYKLRFDQQSVLRTVTKVGARF